MLAIVAGATSTDGSVAVAGVLEAAALAAALLGTILPGGTGDTVLEAMSLSGTGEVGGINEPSWGDLSKDNAELLWEFQSWNSLSVSETSRNTSGPTGGSTALVVITTNSCLMAMLITALGQLAIYWNLASSL